MKQGNYFLSLYLDTEWAIRRVERINFLDRSRVARSVSVDLDLTQIRRLKKRSGFQNSGELLIPIAVLQKNLHLDFDAQDSTGEPVQLISSRQNAHYSRQLMLAFLKRNHISQKSLSDASTHILEVTGSTFQGDSASDYLKSVLECRVLAQLGSVSGFNALLQTFADNYLAIIKIKDPGTETTTIKFKYLEDSGEWKPGVIARLGLQSPIMSVDSQIGLAKSDHKIIDPPTGLKIRHATAFLSAQKGNELRSIREISSRVRLSPNRFVLQTNADAQQESKTLIRLSPNLGEFHFPALMSVIFTLVLLLSGLVAEGCAGAIISNLHEPSAVVTLLALIPTILNIYLILPGEHPVVTRLLLLPRILVFIATGSAVLVAGVIALQLGHVWVYYAFLVATIYTAFVLLLILWTSLLASRTLK